MITAQEESSLIFSGIDTNESSDDKALRTLEAVCVQHEIDHLNGMRILDRAVDTTIRFTEKKIGRNDLVTIKRGDAVKVLKYKKAQKFLSEGWEISA